MVKAKIEPDSVFFLKLVIYLVLGVMWVKITVNKANVPIPFGLLLGLFLAHHDHFQIDRKIEYTVLLFAAVASYVLPIGFILAL
jgi:hypothetical protein